METFKYKIAQLIRYLGDSFFYPFFALYLSSLGNKESQIGLILMIMPLVGVVINPMWSLFAKNVNMNRIFIIILTLIEGLLLIYIMQVTTLPFIVVGVLLLAVVGQPFYMLFDGYTAIYNIQSGTSYSSIRLFGSLGFAIGVLAAGYVTKHLGFHYAFYTAAVFFMLLSLMLMWIKPLELKEDLSQKPDPKALLKNKKYIKFSLFYVISLAVLFSGDAFLGTYFEFKGLGSDIYGMVTFMGVVMEIVVLLIYAKWGHKFKKTYVMLSIVIFNFLRFLVFSFDVNNYLLISVSLIRAITMAGLLFVGVEYMTKNVAKKNMTLGITLYSSLRLFLHAMLVFGAGYFIVDFGYFNFYLTIALLSLLALVFIDYNDKHDIINK